jgi:hypothetical protein
MPDGQNPKDTRILFDTVAKFKIRPVDVTRVKLPSVMENGPESE